MLTSIGEIVNKLVHDIIEFIVVSQSMQARSIVYESVWGEEGGAIYP